MEEMFVIVPLSLLQNAFQNLRQRAWSPRVLDNEMEFGLPIYNVRRDQVAFFDDYDQEHRSFTVFYPGDKVGGPELVPAEEAADWIIQVPEKASSNQVERSVDQFLQSVFDPISSEESAIQRSDVELVWCAEDKLRHKRTNESGLFTGYTTDGCARVLIDPKRGMDRFIPAQEFSNWEKVTT